jgi:hypothetical protein
LRLSRVDRPSDLLVRFGSRPGAADLGEARLEPDTIDPLFDLWYDAPIRPVTLVPGRTYYLTAIEQTPDFARGPYTVYGTVYGRRPLGGKAFPGNFYFAFDRIAPVASRTGEENIRVRSQLSPASETAGL